MSSKFALIVGNSAYEDERLSRLKSPTADVVALSRVLEDRKLGAFDNVLTLVDESRAVVERRISGLFVGKQLDDLVLLYFSGHGVRDEEGQLYLAVRDTDHNDLDGTAVIGSFITRVMNKSQSRRQILILDCCHSGAFSAGFKGMKGDQLGSTVGTKTVFETPGYGRIVLTASDVTQYAWEGEQVIGGAQNSLYTRFLIEGIRTGEADVRGSGKITVDELHDYAYKQVVAHTSMQRPLRFAAKEEGQLVISQAPLRIGKLPRDIGNALRNGMPRVREAAIKDLLDLVGSAVPGQILAAHAALTRLLYDDSFSVRKAASAALDSYTADQVQVDETALKQVAEEARHSVQNERRTVEEAERAEKERLEQAEAERVEKERLVRVEAELVEKERLARVEAELVEKERLERAEVERVEKERLEGTGLVSKEPEIKASSPDLKIGWLIAFLIVVIVIVLISAAISNGNQAQEAARREAEGQEAARQETARQESAKQEADRQEAHRQAAARQAALPRAAIQKVWQDFDVMQDGQKGLLIHVKFSTDNLKGQTLEVIAFFQFDDTRANFVKNSAASCRDAQGDLCASSDITPPYQSTIVDSTLFLPYEDIKLSSTDTRMIKYQVDIRKKAADSQLARSDWVQFVAFQQN